MSAVFGVKALRETVATGTVVIIEWNIQFLKIKCIFFAKTCF